MKKDILVKGEPTEEAALLRLKNDFHEYRNKRHIKSWRWVIQPEALTDGKTWRAYGRISTDHNETNSP